MRALFGLLLVTATLGSCGDDAPPPPVDAAVDDGGSRNGCNVLSSPVARPGDPIGGDTYETFATGFFTTYCVLCHSTANTTPEERNGAPAGRDWDDEASVRMYLDEMRLWVGVANAMPIVLPPPDENPRPTCDERLRFVRWLDAGAP